MTHSSYGQLGLLTSTLRVLVSSGRSDTSAPIEAAERASEGSELLAVRRQLVVVARELGELYRTERSRSAELQGALDKLEDAYLATMKTLAFVVEAKDVGTRGHHDRTHRCALALTQLVDPELAANHEVEYGFLLHDIGKVGIPEGILAKRGALTPEEWEIMKTHQVLGAQIVAPMAFLGQASDVIMFHQERWNGGGYPRGLSGTEIPSRRASSPWSTPSTR